MFMSKQYTTILKLEDYPAKFDCTKTRDLSIIPTLYQEATMGMGLDVDFEQIQILSVDTEKHDNPPMELHVKWQINVRKPTAE